MQDKWNQDPRELMWILGILEEVKWTNREEEIIRQIVEENVFDLRNSGHQIVSFCLVNETFFSFTNGKA